MNTMEVLSTISQVMINAKFSGQSLMILKKKITRLIDNWIIIFEDQNCILKFRMPQILVDNWIMIFEDETCISKFWNLNP